MEQSQKITANFARAAFEIVRSIRYQTERFSMGHHHSRLDRNVHIAPAAASLTLQDLIEISKTAADLKPGSRKVIASRLRRFAQIVGLPPGAIAADIAILRDLILRAQPGAAGVSNRYWAAITSSVWSGMERAGKPTLRRCRDEIPPPWLRVLEPLPPKPHRLTLTPLVTGAIALSISPDELDQTACDRIRDHIRSSYSKKTWTAPYRKAVKMLQRCQKEFPELWPQHRIEAVLETTCEFYAFMLEDDAHAELDSTIAAAMVDVPLQPAKGRRQ